MTRQGQVTLPKEIREELGIKPGEDFVQFLLTDKAHVLVRRFGFNETIEL